MGTEYNISNLFLEAFGLKVRDSYGIEIEDKPKELRKLFQGIQVIEDINDSFETSSFGTPILFPITFGLGTYKRYNEKGELVDKKMNNFRLPIASVISFKRDKLMSETKINGGLGTVKEMYGFDDWQITINGFLIPDDSQTEGFKTPKQQEEQLVKWDNLASAVDVGCELFTAKKIRYITIKGIQFEPMRGKPNIRSFTITALSDNPIELNIKSAV
jgi:hypothetical protein